MANKNNETVNIFEFVDSLSTLSPHFALKKKKCQKDFLEFMAINDYFGLENMDLEKKHFISLNSAENIRPNLELWLRSYGLGNDEKLILLTDRMIVLYPKTGALFAEFTSNSQADNSSLWKLADYLCFALSREIIAMSDDELNNLAADMDRELPLLSARAFSEFLMYAREYGLLSNGWAYNFNSRRKGGAEGAYDTLNFLKMAYVVFNEEAWGKEQLVEKALSSERNANLWLFVACHFICGWRGTDVIRLPMPSLPCDGKSMREQISLGNLDTGNMVNELEFRIRYTPLTPKKTEIYEHIPELKLFVPESLRKPMGIIFAIAASHHEAVKPGEHFLRKSGARPHILSFFGKEFMSACGGYGFSSRRANKSYLQGIEMMANTNEGSPKGYMLAALARSHKGGFGSLPETTDIYLRDAKFSGYRPEFIAREMFERGVFSFIPSLMMEMYAKDSYQALSIPVQTKMLAEIGIDASGLENLTKAVDFSLIKARNAISYVMNHPEDIRGSIADILQNIASGNAVGKQDGFLCLMTASGLACADVGRNCCIGCGYEIYTKTIMHCLSKEYARLIRLKNETDPAESIRCTKILKEAVMPAIVEIFTSIKRLSPEVDIKAMINVAEMGAMLC